MGESWYAYNSLVGKHEGKRPLWRSKHRWKDNIKMNLRGNRMNYSGWDSVMCF
jgi:hypothetical protein